MKEQEDKSYIDLTQDYSLDTIMQTTVRDKKDVRETWATYNCIQNISNIIKKLHSDKSSH